VKVPHCSGLTAPRTKQSTSRVSFSGNDEHSKLTVDQKFDESICGRTGNCQVLKSRHPVQDSHEPAAQSEG
jgi:hypothetical protein